MIQKEEQFLLKDICERLPYGVKLKTPKGDGHLNEITLSIFGTNVGVNIQPIIRDYLPLKDCKPYLRPMVSMTGEEIKEYSKLWDLQDEYPTDADIRFKTDVFDWLNAHHFDYRGLIEKGLALEAPEGMYS